MLTLTPATAPLSPDQRPRIGLALAGGGHLAAVYELGALLALDEALEGTRLHELDAFVGISAGAFLAAGFANRINVVDQCRIYLGSDHAEMSFRPEKLLQPAFREYLSRAGKLPGAILDTLREAIAHPARITELQGLGELARVLPTGLFDNRAIDEFVQKLITRRERTNDFRELDARLRVVAMDLESGHVVRFGEPGFDHVPISTAVTASAALPGLYPPTMIEGRPYVDGALRRTLHASAILRDGLDLLIAVNPLVPFGSDAMPEGSQSQVTGGGLPMVVSQTLRALIQSRMQIGMGDYPNKYPATSMLLIQPARDDRRIFFTNLFSYADRTSLADHAYRSTRVQLLARADEIETLLAPYRLRLNRTALQRNDSLEESLARAPTYLAPVSGQLAKTLEELDRVLTPL